MTQPTLSLVQSDTTAATPAPSKTITILSAKGATKLYAADMVKQSWCINASGSTVMAFHAESDYEANLDYFRLKFQTWAKANHIRVKADEYHNFLENLKFNLPPLLPIILGDSFRPSPQKFFDFNGATFANTYLPFNPPRPANCEAPMLDELFERLFPDAKERDTVRQFYAHLIKKPLERPQWGLLITGEGGEGKSLLLRTVETALGDNHWWRESDVTAATEKFSEVYVDNLSVCFDDVPKFSPDAAEKFKHPMTKQYQVVQLKGKQKTVKREVYARLTILSNKVRPLRLIEDRRWYAPTRCHKREDSKEFGKAYAAWLRHKETAALLYHYFMDVDISDFDPSGCEQTETHARMSDASVTMLEKYISQFIEGGPIFHMRQLEEHLRQQGIQRINPDDVKLKLGDLGYEDSERPPARGMKKEWLWQPAGQKRARSLTQEESDAIAAALNF